MKITLLGGSNDGTVLEFQAGDTEAYRILEDGEVIKHGDEVRWNHPPFAGCWTLSEYVGDVVPDPTTVNIEYRRWIDLGE